MKEMMMVMRKDTLKERVEGEPVGVGVGVGRLDEGNDDGDEEGCTEGKSEGEPVGGVEFEWELGDLMKEMMMVMRKDTLKERVKENQLELEWGVGVGN